MNKKGISLVGIKDIDTIKRIRESYKLDQEGIWEEFDIKRHQFCRRSND